MSFFVLEARFEMKIKMKWSLLGCLVEYLKR